MANHRNNISLISQAPLIRAAINPFVPLVLLLLISVHFCSAQTAPEGFKVKLPNSDWMETEAPVQLKNAYNGRTSPLKLVFHAISSPSKLRFFITQFDYSASTNSNILLAGYLDGVRRRCARQTSDPITEDSSTQSGMPILNFKGKAAGEMFFEIRTVICQDRVYSLEINGPESSRAEAEQCLDGFDLITAIPPPASTMKDISKIRTPASLQSAFERGRRIGHIFGFLLIGIFILVIISFLFYKQRMTDRKKMASVPPPLPKSG